MFFVTFHETVANVYAYGNTGMLLNPAAPGVLTCTGNNLRELRGVYSANGYLYVVNGGKDTSNILCFQGSGTSYTCLGAPFLAKGGPIDHPFALAFDTNGHAYLSNQDSNVVVALDVNSANTQATLATKPSPYLQALFPDGQFLAGTLAASSVSPLPTVSGIPAPVPVFLGGLGAELKDKKKPKVQNSVRDVLYYSGNNGLLFVVDEPTGIVRIYNPATGQPLLNSNVLKNPTHLVINGSTLFVSAGNQVFQSPIPNPYDPNAATWVFTPIASVVLPSTDAASGLAFDSNGNLYVAGRISQIVYTYDSNFKALAPWGKLPDSPEFLLYMGGS